MGEAAADEPLALTRAELLGSYARPYRRWLPVAYRTYGVPVAAGITFALAAGTGVAAVAGLDTLELILWLLAILALIVTLFRATRATITGVRVIRERTADWRPQRGEVEGARRHRPHAGEAAPDVAHDEYAVAVSGDGRLVTFAYRPLPAFEDPHRGERLIPGTPRYAAREVDATRFDPQDAARAAEQLADAQEDAARREDAAIDRARAGLEARESARSLKEETDSTAAALRRVTRQ